jgi:DNA-binding protein HU-beta
MNKEDLVKEVSKKTRISQKLASEVINLTLESIEKSVAKGKKVILVGFGTFELRHRAARTGRNPQNGSEIHIPAKKVPVFSAGKKFKDLANS